MLVRKAKNSDYLELMKLYSGFVGDKRYSRPNPDSFLKAVSNKNNFVLVAEDKTGLLGFVRSLSGP